MLGGRLGRLPGSLEGRGRVSFKEGPIGVETWRRTADVFLSAVFAILAIAIPMELRYHTL